jgi:hypothetical protein
VYGVPVAPGRCRAIVRQPFRFKNKLLPLVFKVLPAFLGHLGNNSVLDEDNIFLHMQASAALVVGIGDAFSKDLSLTLQQNVNIRAGFCVFHCRRRSLCSGGWGRSLQARCTTCLRPVMPTSLHSGGAGGLVVDGCLWSE